MLYRVFDYLLKNSKIVIVKRILYLHVQYIPYIGKRNKLPRFECSETSSTSNNNQPCEDSFIGSNMVTNDPNSIYGKIINKPSLVI